MLDLFANRIKAGRTLAQGNLMNELYDREQAGVEVNRDVHRVHIQAGPVQLDGNIYLPVKAEGLVIFVHGSGSSRHSPRNQYVAEQFRQAGLATLLFDLLTQEEEEVDLRTRHLRFDISLLARRTIGAADWLSQQDFTQGMQLGYFGASTGAAAALIAAAERPEISGAVVSRGGRPDLASAALPRIHVPVLLLVGELDHTVIEMNEVALEQMPSGPDKKLTIIPGATHLFEEAGVLECSASLAKDWFKRHLSKNKQDD